jgi:hypothetical protein
MRGQFFSLDVFIAAIILVSGTVVLLYSVVGMTSLQQAQLFGGDVLRETLVSSVRELNYDVLISPTNGYANASNPYDIRNIDMSLGELIGEYHYLAQKSVSGSPDESNYTARRGNITQRTIGSLIPGQYSFSISIGDDLSDMTLLTERIRLGRDEAEFIVATRSIVAGIDRDREFFGPYTIEVIVWN